MLLPNSNIERVGMLFGYYEQIRRDLQAPIDKESGRGPTSREYAHPAQWASDTLAEIADYLTGLYQRATDYPAADSEDGRVSAAYRFWVATDCQHEPGLADAVDDENELCTLLNRLGLLTGGISDVEDTGIPGAKCGGTLERSRGWRELGYVGVDGLSYRCTNSNCDVWLSPEAADEYFKKAAHIAEAQLMTINEAIKKYGVKRATIDTWRDRKKLTNHGEDENGLTLIDAREVKGLKDLMRKRNRRSR